jgi:Domain of unknown function (DUF4234)
MEPMSPPPSPAPPPPTQHVAATAHSTSRLDQAVRVRSETDRKFMNWWLYTFVVSWITLGIAGIYFFYRRMSRIDAFSQRKQAYYAALVDYTQQRAESSGAGATVAPIVSQLRADLANASQSAIKPIGAGLNFVLTIVTLGIWAIVVHYKLNRAWDDRQRFEAYFDDRLSQAWMQLGLLRHPITFQVDQGKARNFWLWLIISIVTLGIWAIVWDYRLWTDPDRLYPQFHSVEDAFLQIARTV